MDGSLVALLVAVLALVAFDIAVLRWGHDSRPRLDERRDWW